MRRRLLNLFAIYVAALLLLSLTGCSSSSTKVSSEEGFNQTIEEKLNNIVNPKDSKVSLSSNPSDYIKDSESSKDYKFIVSQGDKSLNYMLDKFKNSDEDGLKEYIMAMACSEILKENPASKDWSSGRQWYLLHKERSK